MTNDRTPLSQKFGFYINKVLPLVYDESLSYYEVLCKLAEYMNEMFKSQEGFLQNYRRPSTTISGT